MVVKKGSNKGTVAEQNEYYRKMDERRRYEEEVRYNYEPRDELQLIRCRECHCLVEDNVYILEKHMEWHNRYSKDEE